MNKKRVEHLANEKSMWQAWKQGGGIIDFMVFFLVYRNKETKICIIIVLSVAIAYFILNPVIVAKLNNMLPEWLK
jgi:phosphotransferase system  glucose/maltose/N-acetylglucosamine-specific IIC component